MANRLAGQQSTLAQRMLGPMIAVVATEDAKTAIAKNDLTPSALFRPFGRVGLRYSLRDSYQQAYVLDELNFRFAELNEFEKLPAKVINAELARVIGSFDPPGPKEGVMVRDRSDIPAYLQQGSVTPWFDAYVSNFFRLLRGSNHETFNDPVAVFCVVSTTNPDPIGCFRVMLDPMKLPAPLNQPHIDPNIVKCQILVHDLSTGPPDAARELLTVMKQLFEPNSCALIEINSRNASTDPRDFCPIGLFPEATSLSVAALSAAPPPYSSAPPTPSLTPAHTVVNRGQSDLLETNSPMISTEDLGPLSPNIQRINSLKNVAQESTPPPPVAKPVIPGGCLVVSDLNQISTAVKELASKCVVPFMEKRMYAMSEQLAHMRKGMARSLLSSTKKWFGGSAVTQRPEKPTISSGYSVTLGYKWEGVEAQMRRLGDLAFMMRDYDLANQTYSAIKRDYQQDKAYMHLAGAQEMCGLCAHMMDPLRRDSDPHLEQASQTYQQRASAPLWAERSGLLLGDIQSVRRQFREAASTYIRMTGEDSDLRSALLLEQAGHSFLRLEPAMYRKYAFHLILAGHRYSKCGQRKHALHCYNQALQVYSANGWSLAEDHIYFTVGRQSFYLNSLSDAQEAFSLLLRPHKQASAQEAAYLREFLYTLRQHLAAVKTAEVQTALPELPLPTIDMASVQVRLFDILSTDLSEKEWTNMERVLSESLEEKAAKLPIISRFVPSRPVLNKSTDNTTPPVCPLGETVAVEFTIQNTLQIPLQILDLSLSCVFTLSNESEAPVDEPPFTVSTIDKLTIDATEKSTVKLTVTPHRLGKLVVTGIDYSLGGMVRGRKDFILLGKRLNQTKAQRMKVVRSADLRLNITVSNPMPLLRVEYPPFPQTIFSGEICKTVLRLSNVGRAPLRDLCCMTTQPMNVSFGMDSAVICGPDGAEIRKVPQNILMLSQVVYSNTANNRGIFTLLRPGEQLLPGESLVCPLYLRTEVLGPQQLNALFGYRPQTPATGGANPGSSPGPVPDKPIIRFSRMKVDNMCLASLRVSTSTQASQCSVGQQLLAVELENLHGTARFNVCQISCLTDRWTIEPLSLSNQSEEPLGRILGPREVMSTFFAVTRRAGSENGPDSDVRLRNPLDQSRVTDVSFSKDSNDKIACSKTPVADFFLKAQLSADESERAVSDDASQSGMPSYPPSPMSSRGPSQPSTPPPSRASSRMDLERMSNASNSTQNMKGVAEVQMSRVAKAAQDDTLSLVVVWSVAAAAGANQTQAVVAGGGTLNQPGQVGNYGQHHVTGIRVGAPPLARGPAAMETKSTQADSLIKFRLVHPEYHTHDFSANKLCTVPIKMVLQNVSPLYKADVLLELLPPSTLPSAPGVVPSTSQFGWVRRTRVALSLQAEEGKEIDLTASMTGPGVYDLSRYRVTVEVEGKVVAVVVPIDQSLLTLCAARK